MTSLNVLSLFTGAGGLDLGLHAAGFHVDGCVERDPDCRQTLADNTKWNLASNGDVEQIEPDTLLKELGIRREKLSLIAGGPPCQPFSKSGQWVTGRTARMADPRAETLRKYFEIVEAALPRVMLLENVRGLVAQPREGSREEVAHHLLHSALDDINKRHGTSYAPSIVHLDAADFGVPQRRERVFVIASRDGRTFQPPLATHGDKGSRRHTTTWDAIGDLDVTAWAASLDVSGTWAGLLPTIPEGRNYLHHTAKGEGEPLFGWRRKYWSFLLKLAKDRPSWTIQAQPGPATGPFHWRSRRLSIREMARLQTFPNSHLFAGSDRSQQRQVGNAVPVALAERLGIEIRYQLLDDQRRRRARTVPAQRDDCPPAEELAEVPPEYLHLRGEHAEHPGAGKGPNALKAAAATAA